MSAELKLSDFKSELGVYWNEQETDLKINRYIAEGKSALCNYAGVENIEFNSGSVEGSLLMAYVNYAWNKQSEYFEENYKSNLINLRLKYQGEAYAEKEN